MEAKHTIWEELKEKLPWHKTEKERKKRVKLFNSFNTILKGYLSFGEI